MESFRTMVAGISGQGKSYWVKNKALPLLVGKKPVVVFDRIGEYAGSGKKDMKLQAVYYAGVEDFLKALSENHKLLRSVHVIRCEKDLDYIVGLEFLRRLQKPVTVVLDEAHDIFKAKEFYPAKESVVRIARYGRHAGIDLLLISQRTMDVPPDVRSQVLSLVSFRQNHPDDVKAIEEKGWTGAKKVLDLTERNYIHFGELVGEFQKLNNAKGEKK